MYKPDVKLLKQVKKLFKNALWNPKLPIQTIRSNFESIFKVQLLPNNIDLKEIEIGNIQSDFFEPEYAMGKRVILYVHGGGFILGSRQAYRNLCASLAHETGSRLLLPEYRLSPEFPFPTGLHDAYHAYEWLLKTEYKTKDIIVAGDGAGANIAIALIHTIMQRNMPVPSAVITFSPWIDLSCKNLGLGKKKKIDPLFTKEMLTALALQYTLASNLQNPQVSPLYAQFENFPPVYIQCGSEEVLLDDARILEEKLIQAGVRAHLDIEPGMWHLFQAMENYSPVAHLALERVGTWVHQLQS